MKERDAHFERGLSPLAHVGKTCEPGRPGEGLAKDPSSALDGEAGPQRNDNIFKELRVRDFKEYIERVTGKAKVKFTGRFTDRLQGDEIQCGAMRIMRDKDAHLFQHEMSSRNGTRPQMLTSDAYAAYGQQPILTVNNSKPKPSYIRELQELQARVRQQMIERQREFNQQTQQLMMNIKTPEGEREEENVSPK